MRGAENACESDDKKSDSSLHEMTLPGDSSFLVRCARRPYFATQGDKCPSQPRGSASFCLVRVFRSDGREPNNRLKQRVAADRSWGDAAAYRADLRNSDPSGRENPESDGPTVTTNSPLKKCFESRRESISFRLAAANAVNLPDFQVKTRSTLGEMGRVLGRMTFSTDC